MVVARFQTKCFTGMMQNRRQASSNTAKLPTKANQSALTYSKYQFKIHSATLIFHAKENSSD